MELKLKADFSTFQRKLDWISRLLESLDVRERLDSGLLSRIHDFVDGVGSEEVGKLGAMTACGAGNFSVEVEDFGLLKDIVLALRALGFEFHDDPIVG